MKKTVYLETTIPSYLAARLSSEMLIAGKQEATRQWWDERKLHYDLVISQFVLDEISLGDPAVAERRHHFLKDIPLLLINENVIVLTNRILQCGVIPDKAKADAAHIAVATYHNTDFLLTWNCRHIANAEISRAIRRVVEDAGYPMPIICTPYELFGGQSDE